MHVSSTGLRKRLGLGLLSGIGSQLVTVFQQLVSVPVLLYAWGPEAYGVWLTVFSVSVYVHTLASFGFANAAASELGMRRAAGDSEASLQVFQSVWALTLAMAATVAIGGALTARFAPLATWLGFASAWSEQVGWMFLFLAIAEPLSLVGALCCAVYRGEGRMAEGVFYVYVVGRFAEVLACLIAALSGASLAGTAAAMFVTKLTTMLAICGLLRWQVPWVRFGVGRASFAVVRSMALPAASHMATPVAMAMNVTGVNVVVSLVAGPTAVAAVSVMRTLGNLAFQAFNMLLQALWPEMSHLIGSGQLDRARKMIHLTGRFCFWATLAICAGLLLVAHPFLSVWTNGKIELNWYLMIGQLVSICLACVWRVPSVSLLATNRNGPIAVVLLTMSALGVLFSAMLLPVLGIGAIGLGFIFLEAACVVGTLRRSLSAVGLNVRDYLESLCVPPRIGEVRNLLSPRSRKQRESSVDLQSPVVASDASQRAADSLDQ